MPSNTSVLSEAAKQETQKCLSSFWTVTYLEKFRYISIYKNNKRFITKICTCHLLTETIMIGILINNKSKATKRVVVVYLETKLMPKAPLSDYTT